MSRPARCRRPLLRYIEPSRLPGAQILSEFYHLRRTAIKDLAAYIGFLTGFIGAAPFAWELLSDQLASGSFVRGLWYFFGIVIAAGIFTGTAGLGIGYAAGILWEQLHRHRRARGKSQSTSEITSPSESKVVSESVPRLQLVSMESPDLPVIDGRVVRSVQFRAQSIELDFGGIRIGLNGSPVIVCRGQRARYPDAGSRDALCALIGDRVESVRSTAPDRVEIVFQSGCELVTLRNSVAVA
jgi:hypothetical protein